MQPPSKRGPVNFCFFVSVYIGYGPAKKWSSYHQIVEIYILTVVAVESDLLEDAISNAL
jgi:hypothetical protein